MGLDITAFSRLEIWPDHVPEVGKWCHVNENWEKDEERHIRAFAYNGFERSFRGLPILGSAGGSMWGHCYRTTEKTESHAFRAGSYTGYNSWRQDLADQFNPAPRDPMSGGMCQPTPDGPFYELIWFADNEGTIGSEAAADLLADFREHADAYAAPESWHESYRRIYGEWTRALELAADGGLVHFH
jgi:hypothetical protein